MQYTAALLWIQVAEQVRCPITALCVFKFHIIFATRISESIIITCDPYMVQV